MSSKLDLAIHLIPPDAKVGNSVASRRPKSFVEGLIAHYNKRQKGDDRKYTKIPGIQWDAKENHDCYLLAYQSRRYNLSKVAKCLLEISSEDNKENLQSATIHFALFIFFAVDSAKSHSLNDRVKEWAIFCLTTNQGYYVVRPYFCDYQFPNKVACRILQPQLKKREVIPLAGPIESSGQSYKDRYDLSSHEYQSQWEVYQNYKAEVKGQSSMFAFESFYGKGVVVHISEGQLRFKLSLTLNEYCEILPHLHTINRGGPTFCLDKSEEMDDPAFKTIGGIQPVDNQLSNSLDEELIRVLWRTINGKCQRPNFTISHHLYNSFYDSNIFKLRVKTALFDDIITWHAPPNFSQIIGNIAYYYKGTSYAEFRSRINGIQLMCSLLQSYQPIANYIQGELLYNRTLYFKVRGTWYQAFSEHLAITERSFLRLIKDHLIREGVDGHALPHEWISDASWIAINPLDLPKKEEGLRIVENLRKETFSFVNQDDQVVVPYPTRALFQEGGGNLIKSFKKKWVELRDLLLECAEKKCPVTEKALSKLFPKNGKRVLELLKEPRPICHPLNVIKQATPLKHPYLSDYKSLPKEILPYQDQIEALLKGESFSEESLSFIKNDKQRKKIYGWLSSVHHFSKPVGSDFVFGGPIPHSLDMSNDLRSFFDHCHDAYTKVSDEEGYNRLYLNKKDYLVFDQVFPDGNRQKIELFDLLYSGDDDKLYLYAVKEGFGTATGTACTQIRVASETISSARKNSNFQVINNLYKTATQNKATSVFRRILKKQLVDIGEETFVSWFRDREIVYVYSFLDLHKENYHLENELCKDGQIKLKDVSNVIKQEGLLKADHLCKILKTLELLDETLRVSEKMLTLTLSKFEDLLTGTDWKSIYEKRSAPSKKGVAHYILIKAGYCDVEGVLTDKFQKTTLEKFLDEVNFFDVKELYKTLFRQVSRQSSLIAKLELIKLAEDLKALDIQFRINQINRPGLVTLDRHAQMVDGLTPSLKNGTNEVTVNGTKYTSIGSPMTEEELFCELYGVSDPYLARRFQYELQKGEFSGEGDDYLIDPNRELSVDDVENSVELTLEKPCCVINLLSGESNQEITPDAFIILSNETHYYLTEPIDVQYDSLDQRISEVLHYEGQKKVTSIQGIENAQYDCFLNAALQMVIHSPYFEDFLNYQNIDHPFAVKFISFALQYMNKSDSLRSYPMRESLKFFNDRQEDAQEALTQMFEVFDLKQFFPSIRRSTEPGLEGVKHLKNYKGKKPSTLNELREGQGSRESIIYLSIPDKESPTFFDCFKMWGNSTSQTQLKYVENGKVYRAKSFKSLARFDSIPRTLIFAFNRFDGNVKIDRDITIPLNMKLGPGCFQKNSEINLGNPDIRQYYKLKSFINHKGASPQKGHYVCFVNHNEKWVECDDTDVNEVESIDTFLKKAYILCYEYVGTKTGSQ